MVLDEHKSQVTFDVIVKAKQSGIDLITLFSHMHHELQPIDVAYFRPFKQCFKAYKNI